jgi:3-isopropylmalate dehydratase small subunit
MEPYRREMLLHGLDEIGRTLRFEDRIGAYEKTRETGNPQGLPVGRGTQDML